MKKALSCVFGALGLAYGKANGLRPASPREMPQSDTGFVLTYRTDTSYCLIGWMRAATELMFSSKKISRFLITSNFWTHV